MNIWAWVQTATDDLRASNQDRLAEIIDSVPHAVCRGRHDHAEAMVLEGLALARALKHPWIEVFLRHWRMQSRVSYRRDATTGLSEAVSLFEFAHRDDAIACPQSVCVTQDLCITYGLIDGPGYAEERLCASAETLTRIDSDWGCFVCISSEHIDALRDLGRLTEAEAFCRQQIATLAKRGHVDTRLRASLAHIRLELGHAEEAYAALKPLRAEYYQSVKFGHELTLLKCQAMLAIGKFEQARKILPPSHDLDESLYWRWSETVLKLSLCDPEQNTPERAAAIDLMHTRLASLGAAWDQFNVLAIAMELALMRGDESAVIANKVTLFSLRADFRRREYLSHALKDMPLLLERWPELIDITYT